MTGAWEALLLAVLAIHLGVVGVVVVNVGAFAWGRRLAMPSALPSVSVLVPARNEEVNLATLLPTLLAQRGVDLQIVVVDDASEDGTWDVLQAHADPRLVGRHTARGGAGTALTGLPRYLDRGPAALLTSLVPFAVLAALPVPLVPRTSAPSVSALNGQIWVLGAADYARLAPHEAVAAEVLEDVQIGRYLKRSGIRLWFEDLSGEVAVTMYRTFGEAWAGFQKNAALLAGGRPGHPLTAGSVAFFVLYAVAWVLPSVLWVGGAAALWALASLVGIKLAIDRAGRFPLWVSALAPVTLALGAALQLDSARVHRSGAVAWKGRSVG